MKSLQKEENLIMQEIMSFPREKLPQVTKLLRLLRREFSIESGEKPARTIGSWENSLAKFRGTVSSTDEFMVRKAAEKALEL